MSLGAVLRSGGTCTGKNIQSVVQVAAKSAGAHVFGKIAIGRRDQPARPFVAFCRAAQPLELFFSCKHAQQQNLHFLRQLADFVQKTGVPPWGLLEAGLCDVSTRAAEGATARGQTIPKRANVVRNCCAVYFHERANGHEAIGDESRGQSTPCPCRVSPVIKTVASVVGYLFQRLVEARRFLAPWSAPEFSSNHGA